MACRLCAISMYLTSASSPDLKPSPLHEVPLHVSNKLILKPSLAMPHATVCKMQVWHHNNVLVQFTRMRWHACPSTNVALWLKTYPIPRLESTSALRIGRNAESGTTVSCMKVHERWRASVSCLWRESNSTAFQANTEWWASCSCDDSAEGWARNNFKK